mmetsp:Transcript_40577/g.53413  ORF Transcript_40577/g.53413 Transcript_40577/m.53413 type:complete len:204 (+) Transcript_40577:622-1233(+)
MRNTSDMKIFVQLFFPRVSIWQRNPWHFTEVIKEHVFTVVARHVNYLEVFFAFFLHFLVELDELWCHVTTWRAPVTTEKDAQNFAFHTFPGNQFVAAFELLSENDLKHRSFFPGEVISYRISFNTFAPFVSDQATLFVKNHQDWGCVYPVLFFQLDSPISFIKRHGQKRDSLKLQVKFSFILIKADHDYLQPFGFKVLVKCTG